MKAIIILIVIICLLFCKANEDDDLLLGLEIMKEEDAINIKFKPQIFAENKLNTKLMESNDQEKDNKSDNDEDKNSNDKSNENSKNEKQRQQQSNAQQKGNVDETEKKNSKDNSKKGKSQDKNKKNNSSNQQQDEKTESDSKNNKNSNKNNDDESKEEENNAVQDNQEETGDEDETNGEGDEGNQDEQQNEQTERIIENLSDEDLGKVVRDLLRGDGYRGEYLFEDDIKATKPKKANLEQNVDDVCFYAYEECNYQGRAIRLCGRFPTIPPQLSRMTIRSIQIPRHTRIEFYSSPDFKGEMQSFIGSNRCLINPFTINNLSGGIFAY